MSHAEQMANLRLTGAAASGAGLTAWFKFNALLLFAGVVLLSVALALDFADVHVAVGAQACAPAFGAQECRLARSATACSTLARLAALR